MNATVYSIGHSTLDTERFVGLLVQHGISAVADVRSQPHSRMNPQFNRESLAWDLKERGISYVFLGRELGARPTDRNCYINGRVSYERLAATASFGEGLTRVLQGAEAYKVALMCAEKDPINCHRAILVSRYLSERGAMIQHIHPDGRLESQEQLMARVKDLLKIGAPDMFMTNRDVENDAYRRQGDRIAYTEQSEAQHGALADAG